MFLYAFIETALSRERDSQILMSHGYARAEFDRTPQFTITKREIVRDEPPVGLTKCDVSFSQVFIEREGFAGGLFRLAPAFQRRNVAASTETE